LPLKPPPAQITEQPQQHALLPAGSCYLVVLRTGCCRRDGMLHTLVADMSPCAFKNTICHAAQATSKHPGCTRTLLTANSTKNKSVPRFVTRALYPPIALTIYSRCSANTSRCQLLCRLPYNGCLRARLQVTTTAIIDVACAAATSLAVLSLLHQLV
jgi:hypothetical protein